MLGTFFSILLIFGTAWYAFQHHRSWSVWLILSALSWWAISFLCIWVAWLREDHYRLFTMVGPAFVWFILYQLEHPKKQKPPHHEPEPNILDDNFE